MNDISLNYKYYRKLFCLIEYPLLLILILINSPAFTTLHHLHLFSVRDINLHSKGPSPPPKGLIKFHSCQTLPFFTFPFSTYKESCNCRNPSRAARTIKASCNCTELTIRESCYGLWLQHLLTILYPSTLSSLRSHQLSNLRHRFCFNIFITSSGNKQLSDWSSRYENPVTIRVLYSWILLSSETCFCPSCPCCSR
jgi:hypothetical protein